MGDTEFKATFLRKHQSHAATRFTCKTFFHIEQEKQQHHTGIKIQLQFFPSLSSLHLVRIFYFKPDNFGQRSVRFNLTSKLINHIFSVRVIILAVFCASVHFLIYFCLQVFFVSLFDSLRLTLLIPLKVGKNINFSNAVLALHSFEFVVVVVFAKL